MAAEPIDPQTVSSVGGASLEGGVTGTVPRPGARLALVAPTVADRSNTLRQDLRPIACLGLFDHRFAFGSSFPRPEAARELASLAALRRAFPGAPLSIFGHADPSGAEEHNKQLSGRRARAVHALLTRDVAMWRALHDSPLQGDDWGLGAVPLMLSALLAGARRPDGDTRAALRAFQGEKGLPATGEADAPTLAGLFAAYMDLLCCEQPGEPYVLDPQRDFLAGGAGAAGKGDVQGCGEYNPVLVFSRGEEERFRRDRDTSLRDDANAPNRRVLVYLFPKGARVEPSAWPCPSADEGGSGCKARFWSDADERLRAQGERREYGATRDTFACRFYDRLARRSPCERGVVGPIQVRVVPEVFSRRGNVVAYLERVDGRPLPEVTAVELGGREIPFVFAAPDGRIYFLPPADAGDTIATGALREAGRALELVTAVTSTDEPGPAAASLRRQMAVLRQCAEQRAAWGRQRGEDKDETRSMCHVIIDDGHCRLADALDRIRAGSGAPDIVGALSLAPASGAEAEAERPRGPAAGVDAAFEGFVAEHGPALDSFFLGMPRT